MFAHCFKLASLQKQEITPQNDIFNYLKSTIFKLLCRNQINKNTSDKKQLQGYRYIHHSHK